MEFDNDLGLLEPFGESLVLPFQVLVIQNQLTVWIGLTASLSRRQTVEDALLPLLAPQLQVRMVQAFATQQGPQLAVLLTMVGLIEDLEFVVYREVAPVPSARLGSLRSPWLTFEPGTTESCFLLEERHFMF